jgi:CDGSH-type Zn-finger protein
MSDEQQIKVAENGPYIVSGEVPLTVKTPIVSEHGEPLSWKTGAPAEGKSRYLLCRCGQSENKPHCDGTHGSLEWDGAEATTEGNYADRAKSLGGEGIEIFDDRPTCVHAGFCGNEVTNIWKMAAETGDTRIRAQAMAMVERCPSGALTYAIDGEMIEPDLPAEIAVIPDGPLWVNGGVAVERSNGDALEARNRVTLCRCGQSGNKPLCDGSHKEAGFTG